MRSYPRIESLLILATGRSVIEQKQVVLSRTLTPARCVSSTDLHEWDSPVNSHLLKRQAPSRLLDPGLLSGCKLGEADMLRMKVKARDMTAKAH